MIDNVITYWINCTCRQADRQHRDSGSEWEQLGRLAMRMETEEERRAVLDAVSWTFNDVGFEQAPLSQIAARASGREATFYSCFESKVEMFVLTGAEEAKAGIGLLRTSVPIRDAPPKPLEHVWGASVQGQKPATR